VVASDFDQTRQVRRDAGVESEQMERVGLYPVGALVPFPCMEAAGMKPHLKFYMGVWRCSVSWMVRTGGTPLIAYLTLLAAYPEKQLREYRSRDRSAT
jgi:hypothetical protein